MDSQPPLQLDKNIRRLCQVIGIARSSYCHWVNTADERAERREADAQLAARIRAIHHGSHGTYGAPGVTAELKGAGTAVNHKNVARVMREHGSEGLRRSLTWDQGSEMAQHAQLRIRPGFPSTSQTCTVPGSGARTRTRTGCCASTFPRALI